MKTDIYRKTILTIIAICLTINAVKDFEVIPGAYAGNKTTFTNYNTSTKYQLVHISETNTIDVRIVDINTYDELNVNLKSVDTYDQVKVNLKNIDTSD